MSVSLEKALFSAVDKGSIKKVKALINLGADLNALDYQGDTILHVMCKKDYQIDTESAIEFANFLASSGVDVNALNTEGKTAINVIKNLKESSPSGGDCYKEVKEKAFALFRNGADISGLPHGAILNDIIQYDMQNKISLMLDSYEPEKIINYLGYIDWKSEKLLTDSNGKTYFDLAVEKEDLNSLKQIISNLPGGFSYETWSGKREVNKNLLINAFGGFYDELDNFSIGKIQSSEVIKEVARHFISESVKCGFNVFNILKPKDAFLILEKSDLEPKLEMKALSKWMSAFFFDDKDVMINGGFDHSNVEDAFFDYLESKNYVDNYFQALYDLKMMDIIYYPDDAVRIVTQVSKVKPDSAIYSGIIKSFLNLFSNEEEFFENILSVMNASVINESDWMSLSKRVDGTSSCEAFENFRIRGYRSALSQHMKKQISDQEDPITFA
ncbi:MAG: ankyrin repeat domain-containing protein [Methyloprofundus sp.]|nr:ankyrin repeat domain-containing protein [Methyloprofundus sp.]